LVVLGEDEIFVAEGFGDDHGSREHQSRRAGCHRATGHVPETKICLMFCRESLKLARLINRGLSSRVYSVKIDFR
jgi:hypothetical protein